MALQKYKIGEKEIDLDKCSNIEIDNIVELIESANHILLAALWKINTFKGGYELAKSLNGDGVTKVHTVGSAVFQDITSLSMEIYKRGIDQADIDEFIYKNQRFDHLQNSDRFRDGISKKDDINWIEKTEFFCDYTSKTCNIFDEKMEPLIWDNAHLTKRAYLPYAQFLAEKMLQ